MAEQKTPERLWRAKNGYMHHFSHAVEPDDIEYTRTDIAENAIKEAVEASRKAAGKIFAPVAELASIRAIKNDEYKERVAELEGVIESIRDIACGEDQVAEDDSEGMGVIFRIAEDGLKTNQGVGCRCLSHFKRTGEHAEGCPLRGPKKT